MTIRRVLAAALLFAVIAAGGSLLRAARSPLADEDAPVRVEGALVPDRVPAGGAFTAWVQLRASADAELYGQLRICDAEGRCLHAARQELRPDGTPSLVRATRDVPPGLYQVDVLILARTGTLGVVRTVARYAYEVRYG